MGWCRVTPCIPAAAWLLWRGGDLIGLSNCSFTGRNDMLDVVGDTKCSLGLVCGDGESRSEVRGEVDRSVVLWTPAGQTAQWIGGPSATKSFTSTTASMGRVD